MKTCLERTLIIISLLVLSSTSAISGSLNNCCEKLGGIRYCDSSAGRYVCNNGDYSACYCTRHAVMDLQKIAGCCLWQGGVFKVTTQDQVICNNGLESEICGLQKTIGKQSMYLFTTF